MAKKKKAVSAVQEFMDKGISPNCPKELNPTATQKVETELTHEKPQNEPVPVTEVKALSEEVLNSLYNKHGLPREFNPAEPKWNIPSMKNRYALLMADIAVHEKL